MAREQKDKKNPKNGYNDLYDDEIDLFDLFQKIWKWKWLTAVIIIIFCGITFLYLKSNPATYTVVSTLRIGQIAGVLIEPDSDVQAYLKSNIFQDNDICLSILDIQIQNIANRNLIKINSKADSPDIAFSCLEKTINNFLNRHKNIYNKALKKINDSKAEKNTIIIQPQYFLDTYTYPSSLVSKLKKPLNPDDKKIMIKVIVAFFSSLFLGIFLSFFIDYILSHRKKN
jgi:hypothetical protein